MPRNPATDIALMRASIRVLLFFACLFAPAAHAGKKPDVAPVIAYDARFQPVFSREGMVVSSEEIASRVGARILAAGGNAVDAAVATGFALAVTYPQAGNIGGGGFMLVHLADKQRTVAIDYREIAPRKAFAKMFLDEQGNVVPDRSRLTHLAAGVPGTVAGLLHAHERYGRMSRAQVMAPAIALAEGGFPVSFTWYSTMASPWGQRLLVNPAAKAAFFKADGSVYQPGEILRQPDLAHTLRLIADQGRAGFYNGEVADELVDEMKRGGGLISARDLREYKVVERAPVRGAFHGFEIVSMPPPSSGGVHLVQMLNVLDGLPLTDMQHNSAQYIHVLAETMKYAYADRSKHLGDPDFFHVPVGQLTSTAYARDIRTRIDMTKATPSVEIAPTLTFPKESTETTHYSVMDRDGNLVSNTYTLNFSFGSGIMVSGAGFLLNNEMDDFSAKPGAPNAFKLIGDAANGVEPRKRPLSSMTPAIVLRDGNPVLVTGAPGGPRIITVVMQIVLNALLFDMNIADATAQSRVHHQWLPDELVLEPGISPDTAALLKEMGYSIAVRGPSLGNAQSIVFRDGLMMGASDTRRPGGAAATVESVSIQSP
jgi:gamma-glutamyltranspeptidase / glutathione hydrolase